MFRPSDVKHLEVMAELDNSVPQEPQKLDLSDLYDGEEGEQSTEQKILALCNQLRGQGFESQASNLEDKLILFKQADVHLYRVHDEDGEDLINAAHPDGDVKMGDAEDGLGEVETIVSRHKKMVDVVNKAPLGKQAQAMVPVKTIADKFAHFATDLDSTILSKARQAHGDTGNYYQMVAMVHELALTVAKDLNSTAQVPEATAVQLVKNRMMNAGFESIAERLNSLADVDQAINTWMMNFNSHNPVKTALNHYVGRVASILKNAQELPEGARAIWNAGKGIKTLLGDVFDQAEEAKSALETLKDDSTAKTSVNLLQQINSFMGQLDILLTERTELDNLISSELAGNSINVGQKIAQFKAWKTQADTLKAKIRDVKNGEHGWTSKLYHALTPSNFTNASLALTDFNNKADTMIGQLNTKLAEKPTATPNAAVPGAPSNDAAIVAQETEKLKGWKQILTQNPKNFKPSTQKGGIRIIDMQLGKLQSAQPGQLNEILADNQRFQKEWID